MAGGVEAYADSALNRIYNLLFADDVDAFAELVSDPKAVAADESAEARLRAVAFRQLAALGEPAPADPPLLGVIVELALDEGLDTLAAYADGGVRYLNHAGGMAVIEGGGILDAQVEALMLASRPVVAAIGPWDGDRLPPPATGDARITFLVGGRIYFGNGPFAALAGDPMAGPVIGAALTLLQAVVALPTGQADAANSAR